MLGARLSAAHGIWIDNDDISRLAAVGLRAVHNPMSNLRLGSGVAPTRALLDAGVRLGIGTDASNTSDGQNMFEALRLAAFLSRVGDADYGRWLSAEEVIRAATEGSAKILGFRPHRATGAWLPRRHRVPGYRPHQLRAAARSACSRWFSPKMVPPFTA